MRNKQAVNRLDDQIFKDAYPGGGRDSYHPKMLTKVIIYAYTQRIYSSRQIAKAVRVNVMFMWIAVRQRPDFRTINRFRSERMKDVLEIVFTGVLQFLADEKYVKLEHYFVDGTKIEANANRQTLFTTIEATEKQEENEQAGQDLAELGEASALTSEKLEAAVQQLEAKLQSRPKDKPLKKAVRSLRKDLLPRLQKYETQQEILGNRNSFSKTDRDATFM
jgi:transposase